MANPSWNLLNESWDSLSAWNTFGPGTVQIDPAGQLYVSSGPSSPDASGVDRTLSPLPSNGLTIEFRAILYNYFCHFRLDDGQNLLWFNVSETSIRLYTNSGWQQFNINNLNTWYTWRLLFDSNNQTLKVYRDSVFVTEFNNVLYTLSSADGYVNFSTSREGGAPPPFYYSSGSFRLDYAKMDTGLYIPFETVSAKACVKNTQYISVSSQARININDITKTISTLASIKHKAFYLGTSNPSKNQLSYPQTFHTNPFKVGIIEERTSSGAKRKSFRATKQLFELGWQRLKQTDLDYLEDLYRKNQILYFTTDENITYNVVFKPLDVKKLNGTLENLYEVNVELEEQ